MFPKPKLITVDSGNMYFGKKLNFFVGKKFMNPERISFFKELFSNFTNGVSELNIVLTEEENTAVFSVDDKINECEKIEYSGEYAIHSNENKCFLYYNKEIGLCHAFCTFLSLIEMTGKEEFIIPVVKIDDHPTIDFRVIHICVFPETRYEMLKKFIRMASFIKYSHIVLEFWGTFKYKCLDALSREGAFTAEQVKELVKEANALGVEIIPMLNLLGHAAQSRAVYCKHVTLDQNPELSYLFEPDGWTWNILCQDTLVLLRKMREELIDACGNGNYFFIGCDEAFPYGTSRLFEGKDKTLELIKYINGVSEELKAVGRRAIMWGDQLLWKKKWIIPEKIEYIAYGETKEIAEKLIKGISRDVLIADWQYYSKDKVMPTSKYFAQHGFDVAIAMFDCAGGTKTCVKNVVEQGYFGIIQTTWHLMHENFHLVLKGANYAWNGDVSLSKMDSEMIGFNTIAYYRKLLPPKGVYENSGIHVKEIEP